MARLCKHGTIVGELKLTKMSVRFMSDGTKLVNNGFGWKLAKTRIDDPAKEYAERVARDQDWEHRRPVGAAFRRALQAEAGLSKRWKLLVAIEMMPDDPDGVWSECCDGYGDNVHADLDDIVELCRLYKAAQSEAKALRDLRAAA